MADAEHSVPAALRIAFVLETPLVTGDQESLLQWCAREPGFTVTHVFAWRAHPPSAPRALIVERVQTPLLRRYAPGEARRNARRPPGDIVPSPLAAGDALPSDIDILVDLRERGAGTDLPRGPGLGTLIVRLGDPRVARGGPPGFWEVEFRHATTGYAIEYLAPGASRARMILTGSQATRFFYLLNRAALRKKAAHYLRQALARLRDGRLTTALEQVPIARPRLDDPSSTRQALHLFRLAAVLARKALGRLTGKQAQRWEVAFAPMHWRELDMTQGVRIDNPPGHFLADPFIVEVQGQVVCYVEDFDDAKGRACISAYALTSTGARRLGEAIVEPFHMSFPMIFRHGGNLYMCPETSEAREIRVYRCRGGALDWELAAVLMRDVSAADTLVLAHEGRWWLLTNLDAGGGDHSSELCAFYANHPLADTWTPHAANPLILDAAHARNGGFLTDGEAIYRVAQRQGFATYGEGTSIRRITALSPENFAEQEIARIDPVFFPRQRATHHIHGDANYTAFDFIAD